MSRSVIYVAGPYTAATVEEKLANVAKAEVHAKAMLKIGLVPLVPHRISALWDLDPELEFAGFQHQTWLDNFCFPLLRRCDAVFLTEGWENSVGSLAEKAEAERLKIPVVTSVTELGWIFGGRK